MRFPARDLTDQYISSSYQDVLQQYHTTGSSLYVLDGYGNVVFGIPSSSLGNSVITSDVTSSMTVLSASYSQIIDINVYKESSSFASSSISSSYADSASYSLTSAYADSAGTAVYSEYAGTASLSAESISSSYSETASYVNPSSIIHNELLGLQGGIGSDYYHLSSASLVQINSGTSSYSLTASYALNAAGGTLLATGSSYPITASWAINWNSSSVVSLINTKQNNIATGSTVPFTSSWATNVINDNNTWLTTGSTYPITSSWAITSSFAISASWAPTSGSIGSVELYGTFDGGTPDYFFGGLTPIDGGLP